MRSAERLCLVLLAFMVPNCTSTDNTSSDVTKCVASSGPTGRVIPLGAECLRLRSAKVRRAGVFQPLDLSAVTVTPIGLEGIELTVSTKGVAEAFELSIENVRGNSLLQQGYQSWSFAGAVQVPPTLPRHEDGGLLTKAPLLGDPLDETVGISYGSALIGDSAERTLVVGATSANVATTAIGVNKVGELAAVTIVYGASRESLPIDAAGNALSEPLFIASGSAKDTLSRLAERIRAAAKPELRVANRPPGGWYSWNEFFDKVDEKAIVAHIDVVANKLAPKGMPLVEIDDGWEVAWGDWVANSKFPSGMAGIGKAITDKGLIPGVWLAPFLVDIKSAPASKLDPTLFVRGLDGKPIVHKPSGSPYSYYVLDGTNPESMKVVAKPISDLAASGFRFFKLDFLYAGAIPGLRFVKEATGNQALRMGLLQLRKAMGETSIFNACGAPILPMIGLADSLRIGSDTAFAGLSLNWAAVVFAARSTSARSYLSPLVFLDGDQVQARAPFTPDEYVAGAAVAAMSGPAYALGDDLTKLAADRLASLLDPKVLDLAGGSLAAMADNPLEGAAEGIVSSPIFDVIRNPGSTGAPPPTRFTMTGKSGKKYTLVYAWTENHRVVITP